VTERAGRGGSAPPPDARRKAGIRGEEAAARHLLSRGYRIRDRNFRTRRGEIDLIAERGREVVFVEVRYRKSEEFGGPAASVDWRKRRRIVLAARVYLAMCGLAERPCRFDLIAITPGPGGSARIEHLENAFDGSGAPTGGWSRG
jgi:putative endonuclease